MASSGGADPISAIANALGSLYGAIGGIVTSFNQKKIEKERTKQLAELTTQERIKYDELITSGNYTMASNLLANKETYTKSSQINTYIIIGFTFLIVMVIIYGKIKKQ